MLDVQRAPCAAPQHNATRAHCRHGALIRCAASRRSTSCARYSLRGFALVNGFAPVGPLSRHPALPIVATVPPRQRDNRRSLRADGIQSLRLPSPPALRSLPNGTPPADAATPSSLRRRSASVLRHGSHYGAHHRRFNTFRAAPSTERMAGDLQSTSLPRAPSTPLNRAPGVFASSDGELLRSRRTYGHCAPLCLHCAEASPTATPGCKSPAPTA